MEREKMKKSQSPQKEEDREQSEPDENQEEIDIQKKLVDLPRYPFHGAEFDQISRCDSCNLSQNTEETRRIEEEKNKLKSI